MADKYQLIDQQIFLSLLAETAVNTPWVLSAEFVGALLDVQQPPTPDVSRTADTMVGTGAERAQHLRKGWSIPIPLPANGLLNTETAARLGTRCLGGTRVVGADLGGGVFDITTSMQTKAQGRIPKLSTIGFNLGSANILNYIYPSMAVGKFDIAFDGEKDVTFTANLINTGFYKINQLIAALVAAGFSSDQATAVGMGAPQQVETLTVLGTITLAGNAAVVVTAAGMTGTPITLAVAVLLGDSAIDVAGKIRTALVANANIAAWFNVGGFGADIVLTAKAAAANDATMNLNVDNGTCTGLTTVATSVNTRAGSVTPAVIVPPTPPAHHLMHPAATRVTFSDGTTRDFAADGDLISGACGLDNAIVVRQMPGDPFLVPSNRKAGAYARDIHRGARIPTASLKINPGTANLGFIIAQNGTDITSLTYLFRSEDTIGATAFFYEFEWKCLLAEIETVQSNPDGNDAAVMLNFYPKADNVTGGYFVQRVRSDNAAIQ